MDDDFLEENNLEMYATDIVRGFLANAAYGFSLPVEDYKRFLELGPTDKSNEKLASKMKRIDEFGEKYKFGKGKVMVALTGDYSIMSDRYNPDGIDVNEKRLDREGQRELIKRFLCRQ